MIDGNIFAGPGKQSADGCGRGGTNIGVAADTAPPACRRVLRMQYKEVHIVARLRRARLLLCCFLVVAHIARSGGGGSIRNWPGSQAIWKLMRESRLGNGVENWGSGERSGSGEDESQPNIYERYGRTKTYYESCKGQTHEPIRGGRRGPARDVEGVRNHRWRLLVAHKPSGAV